MENMVDKCDMSFLNVVSYPGNILFMTIEVWDGDNSGNIVQHHISFIYQRTTIDDVNINIFLYP